MTWAKTALADMSDAQVRAEMRKVLAVRKAEAATFGDAGVRRLREIDVEVNAILHVAWKQNLAGLRRLGYDTLADRYERDGPVVYGTPGEYRAAAEQFDPTIKHDLKPAFMTRPCGTILEIK